MLRVSGRRLFCVVELFVLLPSATIHALYANSISLIAHFPNRLQNQFTIPFLPPYSGTLAMYGTAMGIPSFEALVEQQKSGLQAAACVPAGTAVVNFVQESFPGIQLEEVFVENESQLYEMFNDGTCEIYINDRPMAAHFVLEQRRQDSCLANGKPIGVIGAPMEYGLSHYAIGIRRDIDREVSDTLSYWMNVLMSCNPLDPSGPCPDGNLATFFEGVAGTGDECGYVLFPATDGGLSGLAITGIVFATVVFVVVIGIVWHRYKLARQKEQSEIQNKIILAQAEKERELNEVCSCRCCG
jgi:hypothetical protein